MGRLIRLLEKLVFFVAGSVPVFLALFLGATQRRWKWQSLLVLCYCQRSCI